MAEENPLLWGMLLQHLLFFPFHIHLENLEYINSVIVTEQYDGTAVLSYISFAKSLLVYYFLTT